MTLLDSINRFYYQMTLDELRMMNENTLYPNITHNSLLYLDIISYTENCTVSYLAKVLHNTKAGVTNKINKLIEQGLVTKTPSETDGRVSYLSLSQPVRAQYNQYDETLDGAIQMLESRFSGEDLGKFTEILNAISDYYSDSPLSEKQE